MAKRRNSYTKKVETLAEWEIFLQMVNRNKLYFDRVNKEFVDLCDIKNVTANQISAIEDMYKTDLSYIVLIYGENKVECDE